MDAYITATGRFLPGEPITNDEIEEYIGKAGRASSDLKDQILQNSGIKTRHYAIDKDQNTVYSNARMAAEAVRAAVDRAGLTPEGVEMLAAATTLPDLMGPGHASMVHGELGYPPMEIVTTHGICSSGMMALKNAYLQVKVGEKRTALAVASELASRGFKHTRYAEMKTTTEDGSLPMETAFLRYMLSDGAGAAVVSDTAPADRTSLRIDWISLTSYANTENACMYFGSTKNSCEKTWGDYPSASEAAAAGALAPRQKLSLLPHLVRVGIDEYEKLANAGKFDPDTVTWFPAHYYSERMKTMLTGELKRRGVSAGRPEAWFSNLTQVGNIGSASIYVILDEMLTQNLVQPGDTLLCMVPESGRFAISFMHLTAVRGPIEHSGAA
ncbi:3-oxoacyl-[acyl-carrier-protein] synthase III C-terminal domain-containing protein [Nocardia asteroides]|uniref:thiolase family protein n=1 Tax=Nocardia asteroides TaxID=1824 RepID=UPI001E60CE63|nr:3-oxoacyl-[acyl-carrier-protein] synthase III C-terminal domain-containing protein [Nocardia asteroides]UGT62323.1 3-oxoacyl-ACP synthase [Nocardia asteroides]